MPRVFISYVRDILHRLVEGVRRWVTPRVFISYVRDNSDEVTRLAESLKSHGVNVWFDMHIGPAELWEPAIEDAISHSAFFIACFSDAYMERHAQGGTYMDRELEWAVEELRLRPVYREWFIPVLLSPCQVPPMGIEGGRTLAGFQRVSLYEDWDKGIRDILSVIQLQKIKEIIGATAVWVISAIFWTWAFTSLPQFQRGWLGGWYKQYYWREFSLGNDIHHRFSVAYFEHAAWSTIYSALSCVVIASCISIALYLRFARRRHIRARRYLSVFVVLLLLLPWFLLAPWPFPFHPNDSTIRRFLGSKDMCLWAAAVMTLVTTIFYVAYQRRLCPSLKSVDTYYSRYKRRVLLVAVIVLLLFPGVACLYLGYVGYIMGRYHGLSAIWEGKMNLECVRIKGKDEWPFNIWLIKIDRDDIGEYLLYDRNTGKPSVLNVDPSSIEYGGPVNKCWMN